MKIVLSHTELKLRILELVIWNISFSTMASKLHCTGGTGGVVYSRNKRLIKLSRMFADRGKLLDKKGTFQGQYTNFGINCTLDEISAIGLIQLNKLKKI